MNNFWRLLAVCRCAVYLSINDHRNLYVTAADWLAEQGDAVLDVDADVLKRMVDTNTVVDLQFYPSTPVGSYRVLHWNPDEAVRLGLECVKESFCDCETPELLDGWVRCGRCNKIVL